MKTPGILSVLLFSAALALVSQNVFAGASATPKPREHHFNKITAIDKDSITTSDDKVTKTYKITKDTEITYKGETTTVDKLTVGLKVEIDPGVDDDVAGRIVASDPPPAPKK